MNLITQFITILSGLFFVTIAGEIWGDFWEVMFQKEFKQYLERFKHKSQSKVSEVINGTKKENQEPFI